MQEVESARPAIYIPRLRTSLINSNTSSQLCTDILGTASAGINCGTVKWKNRVPYSYTRVGIANPVLPQQVDKAECFYF